MGIKKFELISCLLSTLELKHKFLVSIIPIDEFLDINFFLSLTAEFSFSMLFTLDMLMTLVFGLTSISFFTAKIESKDPRKSVQLCKKFFFSLETFFKYLSGWSAVILTKNSAAGRSQAHRNSRCRQPLIASVGRCHPPFPEQVP